jgi:hypothetical protein
MRKGFILSSEFCLLYSFFLMYFLPFCDFCGESLLVAIAHFLILMLHSGILKMS